MSNSTKTTESALAMILQYGTWAASAVIAVGWVLSVIGINMNLLSLSIMKVGIGLLISLPIIRLFVMLASFIRIRDRAFIAITFAVLANIAASFVLGMHIKN